MKNEIPALRFALTARCWRRPFPSGRRTPEAGESPGGARAKSRPAKANGRLEKFVRSQMPRRRRDARKGACAHRRAAGAGSVLYPIRFCKMERLAVGKSKFKLYGFLRADAVYDDPARAERHQHALVPVTVLSKRTGRRGELAASAES